MDLHNGTSGGKTAGTELPESPRLRLREMTEADLPVLADMLQDPEVMYAWERTFSDSEVRGWLERNQARYRQYGYGYWLACRREDGEVVGQIGLLPEEIEGRMHVGIGWMLRRKFMKRGFASEGGRACLEYAFRRLRGGRVVADIRPGNRTSRRVAERLGMLLCGEYGFLLESGEPLCVEFYSKLKGKCLRPRTIVRYDREAFVYKPGNVRITLDRNIRTGLGSTDFLNGELFCAPVLEQSTVLEVKYDAFLPDLVRMAVQIPNRQAASCSKYALCRRFD